MKRFYGLMAVVAVLIAVGCAKKPGEEKKPETAPPSSVSTSPVVTPEKEEEPFVIPPAAKKQAKYFPEGTPSRAIQDLDDMLDSYILDPKTADDKNYNAKLKKAILRGTFDIRELCHLALAEHWKERTTQEQDYFTDLMIKLLEKKAIFSKEQGQKKQKTKTVYQVSYPGHKFLDPEKTKSIAMSVVHIPSESLKIELNYKLRQEGGAGWKIYDVVVDGASLLDNYKFQFDKIIDKEGYASLVHRMESKLKDLEAKDDKAGTS